MRMCWFTEKEFEWESTGRKWRPKMYKGLQDKVRNQQRNNSTSQLSQIM